MTSLDPAPTDELAAPARLHRRLWAVPVILAAAGCVWWLFGDQFSVARLIRQEDTIRRWVSQHPWTAAAAAFLAYVALAAYLVPVKSALTLVYGWLFGFWPAVILASFASTSAATLAFLTSRYVLGDLLQARYAQRLSGVNAALEREGALYLFTLRLLLFVPFMAINVTMGLTQMRVRTFWWVSQAGMLPCTLLYAWAGAELPSLRHLTHTGGTAAAKPELILIFTLIGLLPLAAQRLVRAKRRRSIVLAGE